MTGRTHELDEFLASGRDEVDVIFELSAQFGWNLRTGSALDYGCGMGRVSQALAERFDRVLGVDIAPSMIEAARQINQYPDRCHYQVADGGDLKGVARNAFDVVFCKIVLQHMGPKLATRRINELVDCLAPAGLLVFQIPDHFVGRQRLPADSYNAQIDDVDVPARVEVGAPVEVHARVTNASPNVWPAGNDAAIALGCHWAQDGKEAPNNVAGRAFLPHDLAPGEHLAATMQLSAPMVPGEYQLVVDVVQEAVTWFAEQASKPVVHDVDVFGSPPPRPTARRNARSRRQEPTMLMSGIPRPAVERQLQAHGAKLLLVQADHAAPEWESFTYWVTKP
jgi:SAM-dependent methyltransferase